MKSEWNYTEGFEDSLNHLMKFIIKGLGEDDPDKRASILPIIMHWLDEVAGDARMYNIQKDARANIEAEEQGDQ